MSNRRLNSRGTTTLFDVSFSKRSWKLMRNLNGWMGCHGNTWLSYRLFFFFFSDINQCPFGKRLIFLRKKIMNSVVNFTNFLQAAFTLADPKSAIKLLNLSVFFAHLGSSRIKAAHRMLLKLTPSSQSYKRNLILKKN